MLYVYIEINTFDLLYTTFYGLYNIYKFFNGYVIKQSNDTELMKHIFITLNT